MDEGIFWFFYVIVEAIRNFLVYTPLIYAVCVADYWWIAVFSRILSEGNSK